MTAIRSDWGKQRLRVSLLYAGGWPVSSVTACGGSPPPIETVGVPDVRDAMVTSVEGSAVVDVGAACSVTVERTDDRVLNCRIRVRCGEEVLYGLPGAGYNRCAVREGRLLGARDGYRTRSDGDPWMSLDLENHTVTVQDSAPDFRVTLGIAAQ